ncbi:STAS/SEC14 domain-containing protein [Candidatus Sumerlaeota bacterium]|nr:STAS/SEC14 domain-containing protein [Candidatus Sumerlaeota bacterium]
MAETPPQFEIRPGYVFSRFSGTVNVPRHTEQFRDCLKACRETGTNRFLLDATGIDITRLSTTDLFEMGLLISELWNPLVRMAVVTLPQIVMPDKFFVNVLKNRDVEIEVFTDETKALEWLLPG